MYVITGASGNTGRRIAETLLAADKHVRVIGTNAERLQPLADKGADARVGSLEDEAFLTEAFKGATATYAMIPPYLQAEDFRAYQNQIGETIAKALTNASVKYIVNLSSLGAHLPEKTGPILGLHDQEKRLNQLEGVNVVHLRPTFFMENLFDNIPIIKNMGINGTPLKGDLAIPAIATKDIAKVACEYLVKLNFSGIVVCELLGQRDIAMNEMTHILGKAIGKDDLQYVQFPYEDAEKSIVEAGLSPDVARLLVELYRGMNEGVGIIGTERTAENTTETSFEEFAKMFAAVYQES